ncbi:MAG: Ig-like domain-containing protein, partial [Pelistega sp.]|nr:Ig-like domain-containing protein [Pelistega sp.]
MKKITVNVNDAKQTIKQHIEVTLDGAPTVIQAQNHVNYEFVDEATGKGPQHIIAKRVNNDLHVSFEENQDEADLIIEEYYSQEDSQLIGLGEDGRYHAYIADSNQAADATNHLLAGQIEGQYLPEDAGFIAPWWIGAGASGASSVLWPILGVLAGAGLIAGAASGGSSGGGSGPDTTPPAAPKTAPALTDDVGSEQGALSDGKTTDDTQPNVAAPTLGTGETPVLYVDGKVVAHIVNPDGSLSPKEPLGEGTHTIGVGVKDAAGNVSGSSPTVSITVDTTAPAAPTSAPVVADDVGSEQGALVDGKTTDDTQPSITAPVVGTGETPVLYVDGNVVEHIVNDDGTLSPKEPLGEGTHTIGVGVKDAAGNVSGSSPTVSITVDTTAPSAPTTAPALSDDVGSVQGALSDGKTTDDTQPNVAAPTLGTGETPVLYVDGNVVEHIVNDDGTLSPKEPLGEGTHTIGVGVKDAAGNVSGSSPTVSITVDTSAPAKPAAPASYNDNAGDVTGAESTAATTDDTTPGINVGKGLTDTPKLYDQAGNEIPATYDAATGTLTPNNPLGEGEHQLSYTLTDAAGNESAKSDPIVFTVDTTAPAKPAAPASYNDNAGDVTGAE